MLLFLTKEYLPSVLVEIHFPSSSRGRSLSEEYNQLSSSDLFIVSSLSFCIFRSVLSTVNGFATTILIYTTAISELLESDFKLHINF